MMDVKLPPHDLDSEQSALGAMLINENALHYALTTLQAEDFYRDTHRKLFTIMGNMYAANKSVDAVTVSAAADMDDKAFIHTLAEFCPAATNIRSYVDIVRSCSVHRSLIRAGNEIAELGYHPNDMEPEKLVDTAEACLTGLRPEALKNTHTMQNIGASVILAIESGEKPRCVSTGFSSIDEYVSGLFGGALTIVGARPGIGKTCLGLSVARRVAEEGTVMFFSMEMQAAELMERLLAAEACVSLTKIRERNLTADEVSRLKEANGKLGDIDLRLVDDASMSVMNLAGKVRSLSRSTDLKLVVVDYLQLMSMGGKVENRREEVSEMSRKLKQLAMELNISIVALSQLNRVSTFDGAKVDISQLKESGSLEQDADAVWLMDWPQKDEFGQKSVIVKVAKNRHGPLGDVDLVWLPQYQRYEE